MSDGNEDFIANDLSFLEDIDIDGIVEYLSETDNLFYTKRKEYDELKLMPKDNSPNKKLKINTNKSETECIEEILENNYSLVDEKIKKVDFNNKTLDKDFASQSFNNIENCSQKSNKNNPIFLNVAVTHHHEFIKDNNDNIELNKSSRLVKKVLGENVQSTQNTVNQITIFISDDNDKNDTEVSGIEENSSINMYHVMPKLQNVKNIVDNVEQVVSNTELTKDDNKIKFTSHDESRIDLINSNEILENDNSEKHKNLQENIKDISKVTKNLSVVNQKEETNIISESNETKVDKQKKYDSLKENVDVSKMAKLSSAISVKDDLSLADRLQERLYEFLKVKFSDINVIHYGRYSKIFKCQENGKKYALKVINSNLDVKQFGTEKGKMLNKLQQTMPRDKLHFCYLFASFGYEMSWGFLFDFFPRNLREELQKHGPMHIGTVENLSRQLIRALNRLKSQHIIHSDIKPEHILLNESATVLKLCGFDRAYHMDEETILPNIGTPSYRAPEVILGHSASFSIDMWSTGLVIYEMMTNIKLFRGSFNNDILFKQMCLLGNMPSDMITNSIYGVNHFHKRFFLKKEGVHGKNIRVIHNFVKNNSYKREPYKMYNKHWRHATSKVLQEDDIKMINTLVDMLHKMLLLHPDNRIPIEVLYNHPFTMRTFY